MMDFVSWDDEIPNIWKNKTCPKPPTSLSKYINDMYGGFKTLKPGPLMWWRCRYWCSQLATGKTWQHRAGAIRKFSVQVTMSYSNTINFWKSWNVHPSSSIIHHHLQEILSLFGFSCHKTNISYTSLEPIKGTQRVDPIRWVPSPNCLWPCLGDFGGSSWCDMNCYEMLWFNVTLCHYVIIFIALLYALPRFKDRCQAMPKTGTKT
jgi:hypothetical protein